MPSTKRHSWIEPLLWTALVAGSLALFSGCDLRDDPKPGEELAAAECNNNPKYTYTDHQCLPWSQAMIQNVKDIARVALGEDSWLSQGTPPKAPAAPCPAIKIGRAPCR